LQEYFHACWRWTGNPTGTSISTFPKLNSSPFFPYHLHCSSPCTPDGPAIPPVTRPQTGQSSKPSPSSHSLFSLHSLWS
jgi:hypothetical protein